VPLTRDRVLRAAVKLADDQGIEALSMRRLGQSLGVEAMSLYNHVASKDDLLDGIVDLVAAELETQDPGAGWKTVMRGYAMTSHEVLLRHPWAAALAESRTQSGPIRLGYLETVLGTLRDGGFSVAGAYRANLTLDSYIYGFTLQEVAWPTEPDELPDSAAAFVERAPASEYPHLIEIASLVADPAFERSGDFEFGLDLILDGLEITRTAW
jgi:AcrR family transcriptional regulator